MGDSGGPPWIQTAQGLVQIGVVQGGGNPVGLNCEYGDIGDWTPINLFLGWIAQNDPLREVTAAPGNFNWSNPAAWVDRVAGVVSAVPNNTVISYTAGARYYDVTLSNPGTITLDMNPTIDTLAIAGAQSQLVLPAGFILTTVLSTTLSTGTLAMSGGTLVSPEMLISGGLLTGNGTIVSAGGNTGVCSTGVCNAGGTVMPVGTLAIQGNYTQSLEGIGELCSPLTCAMMARRIELTSFSLRWLSTAQRLATGGRAALQCRLWVNSGLRSALRSMSAFPP
jgi:hypothetical protein